MESRGILYFIFWNYYKCYFLKVSNSMGSLLIYRVAVEFCTLILYHLTLLNLVSEVADRFFGFSLFKKYLSISHSFLKYSFADYRILGLFFLSFNSWMLVIPFELHSFWWEVSCWSHCFSFCISCFSLAIFKMFLLSLALNNLTTLFVDVNFVSTLLQVCWASLKSK